MKKALAFVLTAVFFVAAWGADYVVEPAAPAAAVPEVASTDDRMELKWDSGTVKWWLIWYTGADTWIGIDFDISTISTYSAIEAIKLQANYNWPNLGWDGFYLGIFAFSGGVPGSLLWGPKFVIPTGTTGWKEFGVDWTLPAGMDKFVAAQEQFYNWPPDGDPFALDDNPVFTGHSWEHYYGVWFQFRDSSFPPYRNLMIRAVLNNETLNVSPTSLGRVKALYY